MSDLNFYWRMGDYGIQAVPKRLARFNDDEPRKNGVQADMSDYIKREDAMRVNPFGLYDGVEFQKIVKAIPSADVAPVRHGRWDYDPSGAWCSVCGEYSEVESNYCGNCGAKMDGDYRYSNGRNGSTGKEDRKIMTDYIKREDVIRSIADHDEFKGERWAKEAWADYLIEDVKPADVAPVRHGKWIEKAFHIMCSECGAGFKDEIGYMICDDTYNYPCYCPVCGARMNKENKDEL